MNYFGSLNQLRIEAGFIPQEPKGGEVSRYTKEKLISVYKEFSEKIGKTDGAGRSDILHGDIGISFSTFIRYFGSLEQLRIEAGYIPV